MTVDTDRLPLLASADVVVVGSGSAGSTAAIAAARTGASVVLVEKAAVPRRDEHRRSRHVLRLLDAGRAAAQGRRRDRRRGRGGAAAARPGRRAPEHVRRRHRHHLPPGAPQGGLGVARGRRGRPRPAPRLPPGRRRPRRPGRRRSWWRRRPGSGGSPAESSSTPRATPTSAPSPGSASSRPGDLAPAQTLTTTFRLANVDIERRRAVARDELHGLMAEAAASGAYDLPRREGSDHVTPVEGMTATVMTRLPSTERRDGRLVGATDPELLTRREMEGRRQALEYVRFLVDRVPGYERASLAGAVHPGRRPRDAPGPRRLPSDPRRRPGGPPVRRPGRPLRCTDRGPPRGRRHRLALPARRRSRRDPLPDAARPRRGERPRRRPLLLGHPRRPRGGPLDGPVHGDGPGCRHRRGARGSRRDRPARAREPSACATACAPTARSSSSSQP